MKKQDKPPVVRKKPVSRVSGRPDSAISRGARASRKGPRKPRPPSVKQLRQLKEKTKEEQGKEILKDFGKMGSQTFANGFKEPKQNFLKKRTLKPLKTENRKSVAALSSKLEDSFEKNSAFGSQTMSNFTA